MGEEVVVGKAQRFERRLQGMVGDAFARVFGGNVVPQEVAQELQREADDNARPLAGGRMLAPNRYTVRLGVTDYDRLADDEQRVVRMLNGCIQSYLVEQAWDVYGDVAVALKRSASLHTGQFRISSSVDPDTPQPRTTVGRADRQASVGRADNQAAGDRAMSEQQGAYAEDAQHDQYDYRQLSASLLLDDGSDRYYQLAEGATVVGRGQEAQFRLPDTGVSRRHLEITWDGWTAMLADLGSTNGTTVNGTPVQTWQLVDGDVVRVGQSRLVFRAQG
ncbi:MAG: DUF3662 and FHA domain-containing protein [Pseudonocardiaceae bacterium]